MFPKCGMVVHNLRGWLDGRTIGGESLSKNVIEWLSNASFPFARFSLVVQHVFE